MRSRTVTSSSCPNERWRVTWNGSPAQPPTPEWGALVASGRDYLGQAWWLTAFPGAAVVATVLAANRLSHALQSPHPKGHRP